ncbi:glycosyltransferase family 2 protein [Massilia niastensis]|uniref:glycosyltransferase family 2 protein n=1 Tax=Massilia niastensis TaxID=544911 RepID=UPI00036428BC|nr:glycosyltransferase family 2 protein [Massilia niastensis]
MKLAITSIQRDRNPWIVEWLAFHMVAGFTEFHIYCHKCSDGMPETLQKIGRHFPVHAYAIHSEFKPQLDAFRHSWEMNGKNVDWMAFIDGDEFLFPTAAPDMATALAPYGNAQLSALAAYWVCYGSSGRMDEPAGLVLENYPRHSGPDFHGNRHMKSIVRGGEQIEINGSHLFSTPRGTYDDRLRPVTQPYLTDPDAQPSYDRFRINHYAVQSFEFFKRTKQNMGAADANPKHIRPDAWFHEYDRNECDDGRSYNFLIRVKIKMAEIQAVLDAA